ncbi:hypothetical protein IFM89_031173 [Coptis chinensis]|uniref:Myb/SANT-like domain-containing protein n=1 Tax=Coptis chinensis TaxID=261450 RepID=A0A835INS5_9MAGN|nr:hypothetical protein IFM89_031173 [Coptis chinensis]
MPSMEKCGKLVTKDNVQACLKTWTKHFNIMIGLRDQSGSEWDDNRKMIIVRDDIWEYYVKSHPDVKGFRYKPLTNYDELAIIVGKNNAIGVGANTERELYKAREEVENNGSNENDGREDINGENEGSDKQLKRDLDKKQSTKKKKKSLRR